MKKLSLVALSVASLAGMLAVPSQVHAGADGSNGDILGIVGSDTTYYVMNALTDAHNLSSRYNPNGDKAVNIPPLVSANTSVEAGESCSATATTSLTNSTCLATAWLKAARLAWPGGAVLPADSGCTTQYVFGGIGTEDTNQDGKIVAADDIEYTTVTSLPSSAYDVRLGVVPPNGSGDGRSAISTSGIKGVPYNSASNNFACLDIARSSSYSADTTKYEYWAFALDAIGWTYFPTNTNAAVSNGLVTTDLNKIYQCATSSVDVNADGDYFDTGDKKIGYPEIRYWNQLTANSNVSVEPAKIAAYRIQAGSGTGKDVATIFMGRTDGVDSEVLKNCDGYNGVDKDNNVNTSFTFPIVQEHDCRNVSEADKPNAICWYGYSRWVLQARALETDKRNGAIFGKYGTSPTDMKRPSFSTINDSQTRYMATRWIYNVIPLNSTSVTSGVGADVPRSGDARRFVGVSVQPDDANTTPAECADGSEVAVTADPAATPPVLAQSAADCNFDGDKVDTGVAVGAVPGFICGDPTARRIIASFGFKPISSGITDAGSSSYGTSNCRRNKTGF
ncbi:unannotated protein [freshwater metagenome]|uniref:Unannotated protein n=1 Tax=freshwater metagenome TaxID=449393 RepID=A0A6J7RN66_9ZZZZ|nr:hypothetical protein [Actinomycetota bacterium]MSX15692.1 hypothetical protein [Actinomycetota bacterium]MSX35919.1 hypothetical protein [Actinomycetota bacterium]MSX76768.1 hypothetical protein [Actinomycetota bacterium]MSZ71858.1 hypothetical protein [Actinomycetota bacterium]